MIIGLTGGIGAGKSVVARILRTKGFPVYDCDKEARRMMNCCADIKNALFQKFGAECISADGTPDRKVIADRIFTNVTDRLWLNSLIHSRVLEDVKRKALENEEVFFVESAILKTSGLELLCDRIWLVNAKEYVRIERASRRDNSDESKIKDRIRVQKNEFKNLDKKIPLEYIHNGGTESLLLQIDNLLTQI